MNSSAKSAFSCIVFLTIVCAFWEFSVRIGWMNPRILPAFSTVIATLGPMIVDPYFLKHCGDTLLRVAIAYVIGVPIAVLMGLAIANSKRFGRHLEPVVHFILGVPQSIFLPVLIMSFGTGDLGKVIFGITHILFILSVYTIAAVHSVPQKYVLAARSFGAPQHMVFFSIYVPAMLPFLVTGLRTSMVFNVLGILLAEMYASRTGLGLLIFHWGETHDVENLMSGIIVISVVMITMNELLRIWEHRSGRWNPAFEKQ